MSVRHPGRPKKSDRLPCKVEGCVKAAAAKGLCQTHYMASRRGLIDADTGAFTRAPMRVARYSPDAACIVEGCADRPRSRGMCNRHMLQRQVGILDERGNALRPLLPTGRKRERDSWISSARDGYVLRVAPQGHPRARRDGTIFEHRLVMERVLGRYLEDWEIVHHKNGDRSDNRPENLELMDGRARSGKEAHPPGHAVSAEETELLLEALRHNDPAAFEALIRKFQ